MSNVKLADDVKIRIYDREVIGCKMTDTEVMVSIFSINDDKKIQILDGNNQSSKEVTFLDMFLSVRQLEDLQDTIKVFLGKQK